jgi:hypothetical protein
MIEKKIVLRIGVFVAGLFVCCFGQLAQAAVVQVGGTCKGSLLEYPTIGSAITGIPAGSTIYVCPGVYAEQLTVTKNLTIEGASTSYSSAAIIIPPGGGLSANATDPISGPVAAQIAVLAPATRVNIEHLVVDGTGNGTSGSPLLVGIYYLNVSGTISYNAVRFQTVPTANGDQTGLAIYVEGGDGPNDGTTTTSTTTISYNAVDNYQKNGITANGYGDGSVGPVATIENNVVIGQGPTTGAAENGIQLGFGATGEITGNTVLDNIWEPGNTYAASGILVYASSDITISSNTVGSAQLGIAVASAGQNASGDNDTITLNRVDGSQIYDGVDLCSDNNTITSNIIDMSANSGIHADDSCTEASGSSSGNGNTINANTINTACAGILEGGDVTSITISASVVFYNDVYDILAGADTCTGPTGTGPAVKTRAGSPQTAVRSLKPSPFR